MTARPPLSELVDPGWATALAPVEDHVAQMGEFLRSEIAAGQRYLPAGGRTCCVPSPFPLEKVRVLIVGQDPYPTPGHAVGLSFSVAPEVRPLPRSLDNIFKEYATDLGHPAPSCGDLTPWAEQGVMMLNRVLTVRSGSPASHRGKGWEAVTECAIRALVARPSPMVAVLSGGSRRTDVEADADGCPLRDHRVGASVAAVGVTGGFFGSRPFSRANELLAELGGEPVDWRLP